MCVFECKLYWPKRSAYQAARKHKHTTRNACILNLKNLWQITNCIWSCNLLERRLFTFTPLFLCVCVFYSLTHSPNLWLPRHFRLGGRIVLQASKKTKRCIPSLSHLYVDSFSQRCFFGSQCCCCVFCCFLRGFISAVGCYFCRINTFKLPKLTSRFLMVKLTLSQDTCRRADQRVQIIPLLLKSVSSRFCFYVQFAFEIFPSSRIFMPNASKPKWWPCMAYIDKIIWEQ